MPALATLARIYVDDLDTALPTFTALAGEPVRQRFAYRDLELATVGNFLLIAGTPEALAPYRQTQATVLVADLAEVLDTGAVLDGPNDVPTGRNLTLRHAGGAVIEYVQFSRPSAG
ncbi:hypothetical protein [Kitasatospora viridis]|uniref:VOC domain-containing protein n=1 Tax=Kitasatospora viridis TaxID=281105 RepID=A0A561UBQ3_9ACTN|nr:hypothetical protein [Kitasatospora viridis]TWF96788.1 hypothetical protein FHX73_11561 [Kitasatospora viridis]